MRLRYDEPHRRNHRRRPRRLSEHGLSVELPAPPHVERIHRLSFGDGHLDFGAGVYENDSTLSDCGEAAA